MLLLTAFDLSEAVLLVLLSNLGGFPGVLSRPIGLNLFQVGHVIGKHPSFPHTRHTMSCGKSSGLSLSPSRSP